MISSPYEVITEIRETEVSEHEASLIAIFSIWKLYTSVPLFYSTVVLGDHYNDTELKLSLKKFLQ